MERRNLVSSRPPLVLTPLVPIGRSRCPQVCPPDQQQIIPKQSKTAQRLWNGISKHFFSFRFSISTFASHFHLGEIRVCAYVHLCLRACVHTYTRTDVASLCVCVCVRPKLIISVRAERKEQIKALFSRRGPIETYFNGAAGGDKAHRHLDPCDGGVRLAQQPAQSTPFIHHFQFPPSFLIRARRGERDFTQPALTPHFRDFNTGIMFSFSRNPCNEIPCQDLVRGW